MKVIYNGIILRNAYTEEWNEECVYDQSGVNLLGNKITFTFVGNVFFPIHVPEDLTFVEPSLASAQVAVSGTSGYINSTNISRPVAYILRALQIPRKALELYYDGSVNSFFTAYPQYIPASGETISDEVKANYDVNNGPKPLSVSVSMISSKHVTVRFRIEVTKVRCFGGDTGYLSTNPKDPANPDNVQVLSNRCWTEETQDANFFTTRTFAGTLRLSSPNISAHNFRNLLYPELERGFKRESMVFAESEDGMSLNYRIVDRQVYNAAPWPATSMSGEVRVEGRNICEYFLTINVSLIGNPGADKRDLISRLIQIYATQVKRYTQYNNNGQQVTLGSIPKYFTLVDHIGETPEVTLQAQAQIFPSSTNSDNLSGGMVTLPSLPSMGDEFTLANDDIIGSFLLEPDPDNSTGVIEYDRRDSHKPNVFGYNIFGLTTDTNDSDNKNQAYCSFIKCLATTPCDRTNPVSSVWQSVPSNAPPETIAVNVAKKGTLDARNTPRTQTASQESQIYPITYYTSYITASTSYNRVLLPIFKTGTTITSDSVTSVVAELAEPTMTIDVVIEAERIGQYPSFPDPEKTYYICKDSNNENGINKLTCLSYTVDMMEPNRDQTGDRQAYRANAHYKYAADRHFIKTDNVKLTYNAEINNVMKNATAGGQTPFNTIPATSLFSGNQLEPDATPTPTPEPEEQGQGE